MDRIQEKLRQNPTETRLVIMDLSASTYVDVAGSKMLLQLANYLKEKKISLKIVDALSNVREMLRKQGLEDVIGHISRKTSIHDFASAYENEMGKERE
jgi:anti-anti-sigma regulatory factor